MEPNGIYHGFRLLKTQEIKEIASAAFEFSHVKSGARLFFLANKDDNKVFSISFRTTPSDDMGIPHIVEHSTLCGSKKFPTKEPFVELAKGSLNTFLNAITFPDKTMYPIASCNAKDFQNLMDVYLDAVFHPAFHDDADILRQEGWHFEIDENDPAAPLDYSGVVYNEMKGALSSPENLLEIEIYKALFPDTPYRYESGGNPKAIPNLTQAEFTAFHAKFYHPSNSYIFLYGDLDIDETLKFIDENYLSQFDRLAVDSEIAKQPRFAGLKKIVKPYPIGQEEAEEKAFHSYSVMLDDVADPIRRAGFAVLDCALLKSEASPLRKALIDAKLGKDVSSIFEEGLQEPYISVTVNSAKNGEADRFYQTLSTAVEDIVAAGIDKNLLEAAINSLEFRTREADFNQYPKGIIYNIGLMNSWLYGRDPAQYLYYEDVFAALKDKLPTRFFENLLKEAFLDNKHAVLLSLEPDCGLQEKEDAALKAELAAKKAAMTPKDLKEIKDIDHALKLRQSTPDTPEKLATIPLLSISDIGKKARLLPLEVMEDSPVKYLFTEAPTNGIVYLSLYFDASRIAESDIHYLHLLMDILGSLNTEHFSYSELVNSIDIHTGGIDYDVAATRKITDIAGCQPHFFLRAKALAGKMPKLADLLTEILCATKFDDAKRLKELLDEIRSLSELSMLRAPNLLLGSRLRSYLTPLGAYNGLKSLSYYEFICQLCDDFAASFEGLKEKLASIMPRIFNLNGLTIGLTTTRDLLGNAKRDLSPFLASLSKENYPKEKYQLEAIPKNEGLILQSQVQYVGKAANFYALDGGYQYHGTMRVVETIMRYDYLWTKLRVQGGAYGAFSTIARNGTIIFASYRDPNLAETLEAFDAASDYLRDFQATAREVTKYIIGTISAMDTPLTPKNLGFTAQDCYFSGTTYEDRQRAREEVLATTERDIKKIAAVIEAAMKKNIICAVGGEGKLKENQGLFQTLRKVIK